MTGGPREWLPLDVCKREIVRTSLEGAVAAWSELWFVGRGIRVSNCRPIVSARGEGVDGAAWKIHAGPAAISCPPRFAQRFSAWALDINLDNLVLGQADRRIVSQMENDILQDLARTVEQALDAETGVAPEGFHGSVDPFDGLGGVVLNLADELGDRCLALAVPLGALIPLCRASFPPRRKAAPMKSRLDALRSTPVRMEALLGEVEVAIVDLPGLAAGDVLVLNRALDASAEVVLHGSEVPVMRGSLTQCESRMALTLQSPAL